MLQRLVALFRNLAIYGLGDAATSIVGFLLLPVYTRFLTPTDYGVIGLLLTVEVVAKIVFRWGVDASFMRLYFDRDDEPGRQRLASTIFWFLVIVNGTALLLACLAAPFVARHLFGAADYAGLLQLSLVNIFVVGFYFLPFHVMRIEGRSPRFVAFTTARAVGTIVLRLWLVAGLGLGVLGFVVADLAVTAAFTVALWPSFARLVRLMFDRDLLIDVLRFGLPRLPHGVAHQVMAVSDRYILTRFVTLAEVGLYSVGASFAMAMKLFLSAFEYAWAPFYFATMREPDAKRTFSLVTTYGVAALVLLVVGLAAVSHDAVRLMTGPQFEGAARVIPWIGVGVLFQGVYLLTSIGLNITKETRFYPMATAAGAAVSVGANLVLIPRFGAIGAAWANALAYAVLAGVAYSFSQRFYPMRYEHGRLLRVVFAGLATWLLVRLVVPAGVTPLTGLLLRGGIVVVAYPIALYATGFYHAREVEVLMRLFSRRRAKQPRAVDDSLEMGGEIVAVDTDAVDPPGDTPESPAEHASRPAGHVIATRGEAPR